MAHLDPTSEDFDVTPRVRLALRVAAGFVLIGLAFNAAHGAFGLGGHRLDSFSNDYVYNALIIAAALGCLARGILVRLERTSWLILGVGLLFWSAGEINYSLSYGSGNAPTPSLSDAGYLLYYPAGAAALLLLWRSRLRGLDRSLWLDGVTGGLAAGALVSAFVFRPVLDAAGHDPAAVITNLAYPIGDVLLLGFTIGVFSLSAWRPGRAWLLLGAGFILGTIADSIYLYEQAVGSYHVGTILDSLWPAATLTVAVAAWSAPSRRTPLRIEGMRVVALPAAFGTVALCLLIIAGLGDLNELALGLAAATLAFVIMRAGFTLAENLRLLAQAQQEAVHDSLTGLGNRRKLMADLGESLAEGRLSDERVVVMFDLDGFKSYNDSFGHMAGDSLLTRLGRNLDGAVGPYGEAYRIGGDEFCALIVPQPPGVETIVGAAAAALSDHGDGFDVDASHGMVVIPAEASSTSAALRLADERMYAQKDSRRVSAIDQSRNVLLAVLRERQPELHTHLHVVAALAARLGRRLALSPEALDELIRAAELHDIGKAAIPDEILDKPTELSQQEWEFMRRHTIIGERILGGAPALAPVAALVRSSHERWDGGGYPDGLAGDSIPLGSRIIFVCDAFHAMTSNRPYSPAISFAEATQELCDCAGSQFDRAVVAALTDELSSEPFPESAAGHVAAQEDEVGRHQ